MTTPLSGAGSQGTPGANNNPGASTSAGSSLPLIPPTQPPVIVRFEEHGDRYWQILQNNVEWVRFSDSKAGIILTASGVLFTIIYANSSAVFTAVKDSSTILWIVAFFALFSILSILSAFLALRPRLSNKNANSIIYFRHIAKHKTWKEYKDKAGPILDHPEKYTDHLAEQIYVLSKVATEKYYWTSAAIVTFALSLLAMVITVCVYVFHLLQK